MDYEKYNNVLEKAKVRYNEIKDTDCSEKKFLLDLFPELRESEDEKIRKWLLDTITQIPNDSIEWEVINKADVLAWLEKQGEQKLTWNKEDERIRTTLHSFINDIKGDLLHQYLLTKDEVMAWLEKQGDNNNQKWKPSEEQINALEHFVKSIGESGYASPYDNNLNRIKSLLNDLYKLERQGEQKPTDKVEPKFHEGDWIIDKQGIVHQIEKVIENVTNNTFAYDLVGGGYFNEEVKSCRLWTIDDAKDGDMLVDVYGNIGIFQKNDDFDWSSYCSLGSNGGFRCFAIEHELDGSHPADKSQRDILFKEMQEAGYEWDAEKKELKLLISNGGDFESNNSKQKPTWSDEDESLFHDVINYFSILEYALQHTDKEVTNWLKSLKERLL